MLTYVFSLKSCTQSLESYDRLKLVVKLIPPLPPTTSPPSSSPSILCIPAGIVSPLGRSRPPSHVVLGWRVVQR